MGFMDLARQFAELNRRVAHYKRYLIKIETHDKKCGKCKKPEERCKHMAQLAAEGLQGRRRGL